MSREHTVTEVAPGLCVIAGDELTSYRKMVEDVVDFALRAERAKRLPCKTIVIPLSGAIRYAQMCQECREIAAEQQLSLNHVEDLPDRFGSDVKYLFELIEEDANLGEGLKEAPEYLRAEIAFGVKYEGALHLEDMVRRRTRL